MLAAHIVIPTPLQANEAMEFHSSSTSLMSSSRNDTKPGKRWSFLLVPSVSCRQLTSSPATTTKAKEVVEFYQSAFGTQIIH
ncbi:hypothetical protein GBA52_018177 [Prunus armeniaca]|nr:hypothetical protein GBA52_018177 [Prunus armeniaca]